MQIDFIKEMLAIAAPYLRKMAAQSSNSIDDYIVDVICKLAEISPENEKRDYKLCEIKKVKKARSMLTPVSEEEKRAAINAVFGDKSGKEI